MRGGRIGSRQQHAQTTRSPTHPHKLLSSAATLAGMALTDLHATPQADSDNPSSGHTDQRSRQCQKSTVADTIKVRGLPKCSQLPEPLTQ